MAPNLTSWGGNAILDPATGLYHIYVSAMANGCPLSSWTHNSRIDHGVAKLITGQCTPNAASALLPRGMTSVSPRSGCITLGSSSHTPCF
jgi:hypothetical protein